MGSTYANLTITNILSKKQIKITALVDTGATFMSITEEMAAQLGFDISQADIQTVTVADGRTIDVPSISPIEVAYSNRDYVTEALVLGDEALMGVLLLEAMDLQVDPTHRTLVVNPLHPAFSVASAK